MTPFLLFSLKVHGANPLLVSGKELAMCVAIYRAYFDVEPTTAEIQRELVAAGILTATVVVGGGFLLNDSALQKAAQAAESLNLPEFIISNLVTVGSSFVLACCWALYVDSKYREEAARNPSTWPSPEPSNLSPASAESLPGFTGHSTGASIEAERPRRNPFDAFKEPQSV